MSRSDDTPLDDCGCCEGLVPPAPVHNDPGLPALRYRVDTQPGFLQRMLQGMPLARSDPADPAAARPLARLLTRDADDPTVALLDAAACVADVLTFYQERIANEGFIRTATERRSVLELARAIGYELNPGVAASVHPAFTVEDAPGAPGVCTVPAGSPVQSVPPQGKLPQVFETSHELVARAEWNALLPRQHRPADMAVLELPAEGDAPATKVLALLGPAGSFPEGTEGLHTGLLSAALFRLDPALPVEATVDALHVGRVYFDDAAPAPAVGELLLFAGKLLDDLSTVVLRVTAAEAEPALKRVRVDIEPLPEPSAPAVPPRRLSFAVPYVLTPVLGFAQAQITSVAFTQNAIARTVTSQAWHESDLQAMIGIQGWNATQLVTAISAAAPAGPPQAPEAGAFSFSARLGFFGHNAPRWGSLPGASSSVHDDPYPLGWDDGDSTGAARTVWQSSQGLDLAPWVHLERAVPGLARASWMLFDAPDRAARAYTVLDARETARADFGLSGRALRVLVGGADGAAVDTPTADEAFGFRTSTAHAASVRRVLAELPIETPVAAGSSELELDAMVLGLAPGRAVALVGEDAALNGVQAAEIAVLADIVHAGGRSSLHFAKPLVHGYKRAGLAINANVAHATHGETVDELLGNGDASLAHQRFTLKRPPVTHLSATGGVASTLELRVAGVLWQQRPSLYGAAPNDTVYQARIDDDAAMTLSFGDGKQGARLPSGTLNVAARYRSGIGPDGEVAAGTLTQLRAMPLGLRGVGNPVAAAGAEAPERLDDARRNAPLTMLTFDRVVSVLDYEDYARAFPGIGKARGDVLWIDGAQRVFVTVAGATGGAPGGDVLPNLIDSIAAASDPDQRFGAAAYAQRYFSLRAKVAADPRLVAADVRAAVAAALIAGFGFAARELGQSVTAAEVVALMHGVAGVVAVDLDELRPYTGQPPGSEPPAAAVPAFGARWDAATRSVLPAELLLVNPAAVVIEEFAV